MKRCGYCGRENGDDAARCLECGTEFERAPIVGADAQAEADPMGKLERIVTLDSEVQAELVDGVLSDRNIPHLMQSYHDSAYDGLFQMQKGWGVILAPSDFRAEILALLDDIKRQASSSDPGDSSAGEAER